MKIRGRNVEITSWFCKYSEKHYSGSVETDANIKLKLDHSLRVGIIASQVAESLKCSKSDVELAYLCGLLHDIGRFRQYSLYSSFVDTENTHHGKIGAEVLDTTHIPGITNTEELAIIREAIINHGLLEVNQGLSKRELFFCKIIRDADKIDIYKIVSEYYLQTQSRNTVIELGLNLHGDISQQVLLDFMGKRVVKKSDMKSTDDFKILQLSWIFDINFDYTLKQIIKGGYIDSILESLADTSHKPMIKEVIYRRFQQNQTT